MVIRKQEMFQECENEKCKSELDELRKEIIYFRKVFNSMKAIANNPDPTKGFLQHNKLFLTNNSVGIDKKTHYFILDMFFHYLDTKINKTSDLQKKDNLQKSILKQTIPRVRFAIESPIKRHDCSDDKLQTDQDVYHDDVEDTNDEFFNKRLEIESQV